MPDRPNILLLFPDQWRWDYVGHVETSAYGRAPIRTPHLDALAARGVRFTQCRSDVPLCVPQRSALNQGKCYARCGTIDNGGPLHLDADNFVRRLRDAGYRTLSCGKSDLHGQAEGYDNGGYHPVMAQLGFTDSIDQRGKFNAARLPIDKPGPYVEYLRQQGLMQLHIDDYQRRGKDTGGQAQLATHPSPLPDEAFTDAFCGRSAIELLDRTPTDQPWFLWVSFPGPHDPHDAPRSAQAIYDGVDFPDPVRGQTDHAGRPIDHAQLRRNYAGNCTLIDDWVGRILEHIEKRGEAERTVVIFASDHGEMLGDHGRWAKSTWHEPSVHVPLIVAGPGIARGQTDDRLVQVIDLAATTLELAGVSPLADADSRSIFGSPRTVCISALRGKEVEKPRKKGPWTMCFDGRWKLVTEGGFPDRLFDLETDPLELNDVIGLHPQEAERLRQLATQV